jgi:zinc protease
VSAAEGGGGVTVEKAKSKGAKRGAGKAEAVTRLVLSGGGTVQVAESHAVPLVSLTIAFRSGSACDPVGREGASKLAFRMLRRGSRTHTAKDIEDELDRLGAELSTEVSTSTSAIHGQVIERNLGAFVDLLSTLMAEPAFPEVEFDRLVRETRAELVEARDSDRTLAQVAFRRAVFEGHPYARSTTGSNKTLSAMDLDAVRAAYRTHFVQGNLAFGFSGDIETARAERLAERIAKGLPEGPRVPDPVGEPARVPGRRLVFVDKPERTQTQILIGGLGTSPHDEDHVALSVANAVFGGSFTSRLMREVRSKRGWSYGAYARLSVDKQRQSFSMWTFPAATDAAACIGLELELLEAFVAKGVTSSELSFIKKFLGRSYAFDVDTASKRLHQALDVEVLGLAPDYYAGYLANLAGVTVDQANAAVKARLSLDDLLVVVVGTASDLEEKVRAAIPRLGDHKVVAFDREE